VSSRWTAATLSHQPMLSPLQYGWQQQDERYQVQWFIGEVSLTALQISRDDGVDGCDNDSYKGNCWFYNILYGNYMYNEIIRLNDSKTSGSTSIKAC